MAAHGHRPGALEGRPIQAPGMLRHGPFPGLGPPVNRPLEPLPPPEFFENKIAVQEAEMERIDRENRRLAETHMVMRQDLSATHQEMKRLQTHIESIHTETDLQARGLVEKIGKMEAEILAGDMVKKELQQAHVEAQSLFAARQNLTAEIQLVSEELQKASADIKKLPEMHAELDALRQEHQKLRVAFEYEKGANLDQVEQMRAKEKNLISLARELEKLQAEVAKAEKRTGGAPNLYGGAYGSPDLAYPRAGHGSSYTDLSYSQGSGYGDAVYGHAGGYADPSYAQGASAGYSGAYGRSQVQMSSGAVSDGMHSYGGAVSANYTDGYGRSQVQMTSGAAAGEGRLSYGANSVGLYDAMSGAPPAARR